MSLWTYIKSRNETLIAVIIITVVVIPLAIWSLTTEKNSKLISFYKNPIAETSSDNINKYLQYIGWISCSDDKGDSWSGSGSIWKYNNIYQFLTNYHVIEGAKQCQLMYVNPNNLDSEKPNSVLYDLDIDNALVEYNDIVDYAIIGLKKVKYAGGPLDEAPLIDNSFKPCPKHLPLATEVFTIGFPVTTQTMTQTQAGGVRSINLTVTNGIISSYDDSPIGIYPDYNYFVTSKIDSGNSGGLAVAKHENSLCIMGIPTSVRMGNYEIQGVIQSINNVLSISDLPTLTNKKARNLALNQAPTVTLSVSPSSAIGGTTFMFVADASDPEGDELEYRIDLDASTGLNWDDDYFISSGKQKWPVSTTRYSAGLHTAVVEVKDVFGKTAIDTVEWRVF